MNNKHSIIALSFLIPLISMQQIKPMVSEQSMVHNVSTAVLNRSLATAGELLTFSLKAGIVGLGFYYLFQDDDPKIEPVSEETNFKDFGGTIPQPIIDFVDCIKNPTVYEKLGAKPPKGLLLYGKPGTGKTLLARAIAGQTKSLFFAKKGSDFIHKYVGDGAENVRNLFAEVKKAANKEHAIIFIDEIDALGNRESGHSEIQQTMNALLAELDGFEQLNNITVIAATNYKERIDPALLRSGRFDIHVEVPSPNEAQCKDIIALYLGKYNVKYNSFEHILNVVKNLTKKSNGLTGADIKNAINRAAIQAARKRAETVSEEELDEAFTELKKEKQTKLSDAAESMFI